MAKQEGRKQCTGECQQIKPLEDYYKKGDGRRSQCKICFDKETRNRAQKKNKK